MKSQWFTQRNFVAGVGDLFIAARVRDTRKTVHSGNLEHYGKYLEDRDEVEKLVTQLNNGEIVPEDL
ncbi:MAG: hypothetical protein IJI51_04070 [Lachnospiraceae bacterium]|nr:hypothetical protein [Lachnospiraceae bacterium]